MRVLDLGCGQGHTAKKLGLPSDYEFVGIDLNPQWLQLARAQYPGRMFVHGVGESLPFSDNSFARVIANVSLPYMDIPRVLREIRRVLVPAGELWASLHPWSFTIQELRRAFPRPAASIYRCGVILNGVAFHVWGTAFGESFQTVRGMRLSLQQAGFYAIRFGRDEKRWFVEARSSKGAVAPITKRAAA